jgi:hypothetical protein
MKKAYFLLILFIPAISFSQSNNAPSSYDPHEIKITGYLQTQFQKAQSPGISSFSGGDFDDNADSRFMIRRGRLKIDRVDKYSSIVFQLDATQNGVNLMDAFIQLQQPGHHELRLTAGLFNRPFGYSIVYSSGYRDFPERARVFQTLMPRERDIGAMVSYSPWKFLNAELALINGSGLYARDYDSKKDIVGNLSIKLDSMANHKLQIDFGASIYKGSVRNDTESFYTSGGAGFIRQTSAENKGANLKRNYYGANLQMEYKQRIGTTTLKAEYITGTQPGIAASSSITGPVASQSFTTQPATDLYLRDFYGYYILFTQQIAKSKFNALVGYDVYDPNDKIKENEIGTDNHTSAGDIRFSTLGYGITYLFNTRVKLTAYNERVINSATQLDDYRNDIKDDVFTLRLQYRW